MHDARKYLKLMKAIKKSGQNPICMETDPELWFPETWLQARDAKRLCGTCPVQNECLTFALETNQSDGIWGGLTAEERRRLQGRGRNRLVGRPSQSRRPD